MGNSPSTETTQVATAKLILQDGRLQEFSYPVKVSHVLNSKNVDPTTHFICSADDMDFNGVVLSLNGEEILQLGQVYFALPLCRLKRPLQGEEMAALAVKATSAMVRKGKRWGRRMKWVFNKGERRRVAVVDGGGRRRRREGGARLSAILE